MVLLQVIEFAASFVEVIMGISICGKILSEKPMQKAKSICAAGMLLQEEGMAQIIAGGYSPLRICVMSCSKLILVGVCLFLTKKVLAPVNLFVRKIWIGIALAGVVLFYLIRTTFVGIDNDIAVSWFFLLAFFILAVYSVFQYAKYMGEKQDWKMEREWSDMQIESYSKLIQVYQENYAFYHDLKNQFLVLNNLLYLAISIIGLFLGNFHGFGMFSAEIVIPAYLLLVISGYCYFFRPTVRRVLLVSVLLCFLSGINLCYEVISKVNGMDAIRLELENAVDLALLHAVLVITVAVGGAWIFCRENDKCEC